MVVVVLRRLVLFRDPLALVSDIMLWLLDALEANGSDEGINDLDSSEMEPEEADEAAIGEVACVADHMADPADQLQVARRPQEKATLRPETMREAWARRVAEAGGILLRQSGGVRLRQFPITLTWSQL